MDTVYRDTVHRRQRRDEEELMLTAAVEHRGKLCADVAAQRGVGFFEAAADVLFRARAERARTCRYAVSGVSCLVGTHSTSTLAPVSVSSIFGRRDTFVFRPASENFTPASSAPVTSSASTRTFIIVCGALPFSFLGYTVPGWLLCPNYIGAPRPLESRRAPFCISFLNNIFLCRFILPPAAKFSLCFLSFMHKI